MATWGNQPCTHIHYLTCLHCALSSNPLGFRDLSPWAHLASAPVLWVSSLKKLVQTLPTPHLLCAWFVPFAVGPLSWRTPAYFVKTVHTTPTCFVGCPGQHLSQQWLILSCRVLIPCPVPLAHCGCAPYNMFFAGAHSNWGHKAVSKQPW